MLPSLTPRALVRTLLIALSIAAGAALYSIWQVRQDVDRVAARFTLDPGPQSTLIFDSKDHLISALYKEHRIPVTLEEMSDPLVQAVIATEDRRFYDHHGVDIRRIGAAIVANLRRGRIVQGGSTITQQFVRGAFLDRSRTYSRKVREAWLAHRLESKFSKRAILQAYLNHVYFGDGYYGVQAASLGYFGKPASDDHGDGRRHARGVDQSAVGLRHPPHPGQACAIAATGCCGKCTSRAISMRTLTARRSPRRLRRRWRRRTCAPRSIRSAFRAGPYFAQHRPRVPLREVRRRRGARPAASASTRRWIPTCSDLRKSRSPSG